jgi:hypothetical protein
VELAPVPGLVPDRANGVDPESVERRGELPLVVLAAGELGAGRERD